MAKIVINFYNKSLLIIKIMPNKVTIYQLFVSLLIILLFMSVITPTQLTLLKMGGYFV